MNALNGHRNDFGAGGAVLTLPGNKNAAAMALQWVEIDPAGRVRPAFLANEESRAEGRESSRKPSTLGPSTLDTSLANEFAPGADGWVLLAPYGDFAHSRGVQRFAKEDAVALCNEFNSLLGLPQRMFGLPWYIGHPDHPAFKDRYPDTKAYGRIKALEAREEGLFANVKWSPAGEELVRSEAFHGHSVNWGAVKRGGVWRPVRIKSVGFTNEPNIPVRPVTLANEIDDSMKEQLLQKLGLAADATDEQILAAVDLANEAKQTENAEKLKAEKLKAEADLANEKAEKLKAEKLKADAETALANEKAAAETLKAEKLKAEEALANERKARIGLMLDGALEAGKITAADRPRWEADLAGDFEAKATELANAKPVIKTEARTKNLGQRKETGAASSKVVELVNERMAATGEDWTPAWAAVKREHPALFEQMETAKD